jgi:DNA repair protein RadC
MQVKGVGESTAVAINLVRDINQRVNINKNKNVKIINSSETASQYCINMLRNEPVEKLLVISLSSKGTIISSNIAFKGAVNTTNINMLELMEMIIHSHPSGVIIAHNHPNGNVNPSGDDMSFTIELNSLLRKINVKLLDHIIVSDDKYSCMSNNLEWMAKLDSSK